LRRRHGGEVNCMYRYQTAQLPITAVCKSVWIFFLYSSKYFPADAMRWPKWHATENRIPEEMINYNLRFDCYRFCSWYFRVKESVEVMTSSSVKKKSEGTQTSCVHKIAWRVTLTDEMLRENIPNRESCELRERLGQKRLWRQEMILSCPNSTHCCLIKKSMESKGENTV